MVGRDGRMMSEEFTREVAGALAAEGIVAWVFPSVSPTPVTAFALGQLGAAAAVMVTASHNPPEYNGYKVYWGNGAQIVPPHDLNIAKAIEGVEPAKAVGLLSEAAARAQGLWRDVPPRVERAYLDALQSLRPTKCTADLTVVYTAMHGVGGRWVLQALAEAGFAKVSPVRQQQEPDGRFPTVRFPNPEEKGAMDLATALANQVGAELVLANDPDADRLAVMARDSQGALRLLSGNEVGVLLGHFLLTQQRVERPLVVTTIVSSAQLGGIARAKGAEYAETLTGFKWISNVAMERKRSGSQFVMGYEEALGYTVGEVVRDKDGIGSALVVADMAAWCKSRGTTLLGYLEEIQRAHGLFVAKQYNATLPGAQGAAAIAQVMEAFRQSPPSSIGEFRVVAAKDYRQPSGSLPPSNVIAYELEGGGRVTLRPSGTEPKIKFYFELPETLGESEPLPEAKNRAMRRLEALEQAFLTLSRSRGLP